MAHVTTSVQCKVHNSFRVQQVAGLFDLPVTDTLCDSFEVDVPSLAEDWQVGAIIGPSGSGKSTIARAAFGDAFYEPGEWPRDRAVIDGFGDLPIKQITHTLTAVGFGSPPSWLKPYRVLSTGEQFRCELARALLRSGFRNDQLASGGRGTDPQVGPPESGKPSPLPMTYESTAPQDMQLSSRHAHSGSLRSPLADESLVVFDEFTSVVDRQVAKIASAAVAKAIRKEHVASRLVVVSCHDDIIPWLAPDWVVDMQTGELTRHFKNRRRLRRPQVRLEIVRAKHKAWRMFARHHYLSGEISRAAQVFLAVWDDTPVAMCAVVALYGYKNRRRIHRLVTLPDFQGIGIGSRLLDHVAGIEQSAGKRVNITTSHPAIIAHCRGSPPWKAIAVRRGPATSRQSKAGKVIRSSRGRATVSFEFC